MTPLGGFPRPKGATPLRASLAVAYASCTSPNRQHGAPLAALSCNPPAQISNNLTVGTLDANGVPANSVGSVRLDVHVGAPGPPDDSDVRITTSITDVRCKAALAACGSANAAAGPDYTGETRASVSLRLTDRGNGTTPAGGTEAGTSQDSEFAYTVPCTATGSTTVGGTCAVTTTANAVMPGLVKDNGRANWQLGQIQIYDGGADGLAVTTGDNLIFMRQGIFTP